MDSNGSIVIARPIAEVFERTTNDVAKWSIVVVADEVLEETPEVVGSTFRVVTEERGKRMEFEGVVTHNDAPHAQSVAMRGQYFDIQADYLFEDLGDGTTRVTQHSTVQGKGFVKVMFALFGWLMHKANCKAQQKELESLKRYIEAN